MVGFLVCFYYMIRVHPMLGGQMDAAWFEIAPMSAGIFGVPAGLLAIIVVSLLTALVPLTLEPDRFDSLSHQFGPVFLLLFLCL